MLKHMLCLEEKIWLLISWIYEGVWYFNKNLGKHITILNSLFQAQKMAHTHLDFIHTSSQMPWIKECSWQGLGSVTGNPRKHGSKQKAGVKVLLIESRFGHQWPGTFRIFAEHVPQTPRVPRGAKKTERRGPTLCLLRKGHHTFYKEVLTYVTSYCFSIECCCLTEYPAGADLINKNRFNERS